MRSIARIVLGALLACTGLPCSAQEVLDSLLKVLPAQKGIERVRTLGEVQWELSFADPVKGLAYGREALAVAEGLRDSSAVAIAANDMAVCAHRAGQFPLAIDLNQRALVIRTLANDSIGMAASHAKLSVAYTETARYDSALQHGFAAADLYELLHDVQRTAQVRGNLSRVYQLKGDPEMAERAARKAVELLEASGDDYALAAAVGQLGSIQQDRKALPSALATTERSMALFERAGALNDAAIAANQLGAICRQMGRMKEGEDYYRKALGMAEQGGDLAGIATYAHNVGNTLLDRGANADALSYYERALAISRANGYLTTRLDVLSDQWQVLETLGRTKEALAALRELTQLKDSVRIAEQTQSLSELQVKYETERTEKELAQERERTLEQSASIARQRLWIGVISGIVVLIALLAWMFIARQKSRSRTERDAAVIAERERGSKATLDSTDAERKRIASELHDGVGQQLTGLKFRLEDVAARISSALPAEAERMKEVLGLAEETGRDVRDIAHSMMPRALGELGLAPALNDMLNKSLARPGMQHAFEHFGLEGRLPAHVEMGVYRIAQELVGNILKHADARNVSVQLFRNKNNLVLIVEDDGKGLDGIGQGMGMLNMHERARVMHGHIGFSDGPTTGTVATLRVPLTNGNPS
ncbi:MAG: sensor histidine kinase [Flavobacteriales bacterium]